MTDEQIREKQKEFLERGNATLKELANELFSDFDGNANFILMSVFNQNEKPTEMHSTFSTTMDTLQTVELIMRSVEGIAAQRGIKLGGKRTRLLEKLRNLRMKRSMDA